MNQLTTIRYLVGGQAIYKSDPISLLWLDSCIMHANMNDMELVKSVNLPFSSLPYLKAIHQDLLTDDEFSLKKNKIQCQRSH